MIPRTSWPDVPPRASRLSGPGRGFPLGAAPETTGEPSGLAGAARTRRPTRILTGLAIGMGLALLWLCWLAPMLATWWQQQQDQYAYGVARVSTLDVDLGHGTRLHLLAEDWQGTILVLAVSPTARPGQPAVTLCTFPGVISDDPARPRVVTLQLQPGSDPPAILVRVEGIPFLLTCHLHPASSPGPAPSASTGPAHGVPITPQRQEDRP